MTISDLLRRIPQVDAVLRDPALAPVVARFGRTVAARLVRDEIDRVRAAAERGNEPPTAARVAGRAAERAAELEAARLRRAINATGVILHTNLGRAPLSPAAREAVAEASGSTALEFDLASGERATRAPLASFLAAALTNAEAAHVVNNNAAALLLALAALGREREVIVSRGQLIEIGGEFRLPAIMEASGAILREVGTTNRTHSRDYRAAINERTAMILIVHPSNYQVVGFTTQPDLDDVAAIAREAGVPLLFDIGSGLLKPDPVAVDEPDASTAVSSGSDLVCFSGDKLLGGPQAGILAGRRHLVEACRRHPLARAVRADKMTLAALEATLLAHARGEETPVSAMLHSPIDEIRSRAAAIAARIPHATVADGESVAGGGSAPGGSVPTAILAVPCAKPEKVAAAMRSFDPPVIVRVDERRVVVDLRTVDPDDDEIVESALNAALSAAS